MVFLVYTVADQQDFTVAETAAYYIINVGSQNTDLYLFMFQLQQLFLFFQLFVGCSQMILNFLRSL